MADLVRLDVIVPPTGQVINLADLKQFVRVDDNSDDSILSNLIDVCTDAAQTYLNRALLTQTLSYTIARTGTAMASMGYWNRSLPYSYQQMWSNRLVFLPRSPVQNILSVSQGIWGQSPDTFLVQGTDYTTDLQGQPARVLLANWPTSLPDHVSVVYQAGYDQIATLSLAGTATATASLSTTFGLSTVSLPVTIGDSAATTAQSLYLALIAAGVSAALITPTMITIRGSTIALTSSSIPAGLVVTASIPTSNIPPAIPYAIKLGAAYAYQNQANPTDDMPKWFYNMLASYRTFYF